MEWSLVNINKIALETPKNWFWEVRGRKWAPEWLKYLWNTAVFTRRRKGAIFLQISEILVNSGISVIFMENHKIHRISIKIWKSLFSTNPRPFTKRLFFLGQMDGPEPWDRPNQEISRILHNLVKFRYFNEIMLNFGDFSRILEKISFWATWMVPGGRMPKTLIIL